MEEEVGVPPRKKIPDLRRSKINIHSLSNNYISTSENDDYENDQESVLDHVKSKGKHQKTKTALISEEEHSNDAPLSSAQKTVPDRKSSERNLGFNSCNPNSSEEDGCSDLPSSQKKVPGPVKHKRKFNLKSKHYVGFRRISDDDDDDDDGLFITQKSEPKTSKTTCCSQDNLSSMESRKKNKKISIKAHKFEFPFLANQKHKTAYYQSSHQDIGLNSCLMESFFNCIQELIVNKRDVHELQAPYLEEEDIPPLTESKESSDEEIKVVGKNCFILSMKAKPSQPTVRKAKLMNEVTSHPAEFIPICVAEEDMDSNDGDADSEGAQNVAEKGKGMTKDCLVVAGLEEDTSPLFELYLLPDCPADSEQVDTSAVCHTDHQSLRREPEVGHGTRQNQDPLQSPPNLKADSHGDDLCSEISTQRRKEKWKQEQEMTLSQEQLPKDDACLNSKSQISVGMAQLEVSTQDSTTLDQELKDSVTRKKGENIRNLEEKENVASDVGEEEDSGRSNMEMSSMGKKKRKIRKVPEEEISESTMVVDDNDKIHKRKKRKRKKEHINDDCPADSKQVETSAVCHTDHQSLWREPEVGHGTRQNQDPLQSPPNLKADTHGDELCSEISTQRRKEKWKQEEEMTLSQEQLPKDDACLNSKSQISAGVAQLEVSTQDSTTLGQELKDSVTRKKGKNIRNLEEKENVESDVGEEDSGRSNMEMSSMGKKKRKIRKAPEEEISESTMVVDDNGKTHKRKKRTKSRSPPEQTEDVADVTDMKKDVVTQMAKEKINITAKYCDDSLSLEKKVKKRTSSFLAAEEEETRIDLEPPLPTVTLKTQVSEFDGSAEFSNDGVKKKKKKKRSAEESAEELNENEFAEPKATVKSGTCEEVQGKGHDAECKILAAAETMEASEDDGKLLVYKGKKKKKSRITGLAFIFR